jgi:large subunit ribosomal protein L24
MKKFSAKWIASKKKRKQVKYQANAPLHTKRKLISSNLSKELRKAYKKRSMVLRKKDLVKIMRGTFKKRSGKVIAINVKKSQVFIEGIQKTKKEGSKINVAFHPSNLQIIELYQDDKKRFKNKTK